MPLDHLKKQPAAKPVATTASVTVPPIATKPAARTDKPAKPSITHRCGHATPTAQIESGPCAACAKAAKRKRNEEKQIRNEVNRAAKNPGTVSVDRLPPGSAKSLTWDGREWHGVLTVPDGEDLPPMRFVFIASAERECFHGLHAEYERWLAARVATSST
jgi:hypothetical protein